MVGWNGDDDDVPPLSPLPGNATVTVQVNSGLLDLSGNAANSFSSTFTTGTSTDTTAPVITMVTPQNGATGIGTNAVVVLTFSESLNPSTINTDTFALLVNGSACRPRSALRPTTGW